MGLKFWCELFSSLLLKQLYLFDGFKKRFSDRLLRGCFRRQDTGLKLTRETFARWNSHKFWLRTSNQIAVQVGKLKISNSIFSWSLAFFRCGPLLICCNKRSSRVPRMVPDTQPRGFSMELSKFWRLQIRASEFWSSKLRLILFKQRPMCRSSLLLHWQSRGQTRVLCQAR